MKTKIKIYIKRLVIIGQFALLFAFFSANAATLEVNVVNLAAGGKLYAALYAPANANWQGTPVALSSSDDALLHFMDLAPGQYALQLFQDTNGNGQLDLSRRGIPREPVGISGNPPLQKGRPNMEECLFTIEHGSNHIEIQLVQPPLRNTQKQE